MKRNMSMNTSQLVYVYTPGHQGFGDGTAGDEAASFPSAPENKTRLVIRET